MRSFILSSLLTLTFLLPALSHPLSLDPVIHPAGVGDLRSVWTLVEATTPTFECPGTIEQTTWRRPEETIVLPHNTIIVDGLRCESNGASRALQMYRAFDYDIEFNPKEGVSPLPDAFRGMLDIVPNANAWTANREFGERFLFGYEPVARVCKGKTIFADRTTVWIMRPREGNLIIPGLETVLEPGKKFMLVVPRFEGGYCLYEDDAPWPNESLEPVPEESAAPEESGAPVVEEVGGGNGFEEEPTPEAVQTPTPEDTIIVESTLVPSPVGEGNVDGDEPACFSAKAVVETDLGLKSMEELQVGDKVHVGSGRYSQVFGFTHRDSKAWTRFVRVEFGNERALETSLGHMVYVNGELKKMSDVKVGDQMHRGDGAEIEVRQVSRVWRRGLYNPQTLDGDVVVDDVWVSTFTEAVPMTSAMALLAPFRAAFLTMRVDLLGDFFQNGAASVPSL